MATHYLVVPGFKGSGPRHWQTYFESVDSSFRRIEQRDWFQPDMPEWIDTLDRAVAQYPSEQVVLVGHSLGCLTIAAWAERYGRAVKAAFLVAPPDAEVLHRALDRVLLHPVPERPLPFPSVVVASTNDPWASFDRVERYARAWGSRLINAGAAGHINEDSGHFEWTQGLNWLRSLG
jgi:predicted alpha/beta hydrolase family esterase